MIIRKIYVSLFFAMSAVTLFAQTLSPTAPAQGSTGQVGNTIVSYTIGQAFGGTLVGGANVITMGYEQPEQNIVISNILSIDTFYKGTQANITFAALGKYGSGNIFTVQLSSAGGSFASPTNIGFDTAVVSGTIGITLPLNILDGNYKMRIVSSYPMFTGGPSAFFAIRRMEIPRVPNGQITCSDSSTTATFNNIIVGNGGNEIEWATNPNFIGGIYANSPATIIITVNPNTTDSIWIRTKDTLGAAYSDSVVLTAQVEALPLAAVNPTDTFLNVGDTVILHASGGVSYFWPQVGSDTSWVKVVMPGDTLYEVQVTGANGCKKEAYGRLEIEPSGIYPNLYVIDPNSPLDTIPAGQIGSMVGCHDILKLVTLVDRYYTTSYFIQQTFPAGITPALNSLQWAISGNPDSIVPVIGPRVSYTWDSIINSLVWNINGDVSGGRDFYLIAYLFTDCNTAESGGQIVTTPSTSGISGSITLPTITTPQLTVSFLNRLPSLPNLLYAAPNSRATEVLQICASAEHAPSNVYGFTLRIPNNATDSMTGDSDVLTLSNSYPFTSHSTINISSSSRQFNVTPANLNTLLGRNYLSTDTCIYAAFNMYTGGCSSSPNDTENYIFKIACNANIPSSLGISNLDTANIDSSSVCAPVIFDDNIWATDILSQNPLSVATQLMQNNVVVPSLNICNDPFSLNYYIVNSTTGNILFPHANEKYLQNFSVTVDTNWIDTSHLIVIFTSTAHPSNDTLPHSYFRGTISFSLDSNAMDDNSHADIKVQGLTIRLNPSPIFDTMNPAPVGPACSPPNGRPIIGSALIVYNTKCGESKSVATNDYRNNTVTDLSGTGVASGTYGPQVSPGVSSLLAFTWTQDNVNGNPWNFTTTVHDTAYSLFHCTNVSYRAYLSLPVQLSLYDSASVLFSGTNGTSFLSLHYYGMTLDSSSVWYTDNLPGPNLGNDTIKVQVVLGDCSAFAAGGEVVPTLSLYATCKCDTCSSPYCFETIPVGVYVHCSGSCGGTGIGTDSILVINNSYPAAHAAYACDMIDFRVVGEGFTGAAPTPTPGNTTSISISLSYLDIGGAIGNIFDATSPDARITYGARNGTTFTASHSNYSISNATLQYGQWVITANITGGSDLANFQQYRALDDSFIVDLYMPVFCSLPFNTVTNGLYNLAGLTGDFGLTGNDITYDTSGSNVTVVVNSVTENSCDPASTNFEVISHQYGTSASFMETRGSNPCSQTLVIVDSASEGIPSLEMPVSYNRPLIYWPSGASQPEGGFTISYPPGMSITGLNYIDSSGSANTGHIYDSTVWMNPDSVTTVYGFKSDTTYYWPDYTKNGSEFLRELLVTFSQNSCGGQQVFVSIPHQIQDGKTTTECSAGCVPWLNAKDTATGISDSLNSAPIISLTVPGTNAGIVRIDPLITPTFTVPLSVNNSTGLTAGHVYIAPSSNVTPVPDLTINSNGTLTSVIVDSPGEVPVYTALPSGNFQTFNISLNNCASQTIVLPIGYTCSGLPTAGNFCAEDSSASVSVYVRNPNISVIRLNSDSSTTFPDCKGVSDTDGRTLQLAIVNSRFLTGPAYNPVLNLANQGPGDLDIAQVSIFYVAAIYHGHTGSAIYNYSSGNYPSSFTSTLTGLGMPIDTFNNNPYLLPGDTIKVDILLFGDGNNCSANASLQAKLNFSNVCGSAMPLASLSTQFNFNLAVCPDTISTCAGNRSFPLCNECDLAPPVQIEPTIRNASFGCNGHTNLGSISLAVSGGPPINGGATAPNYTFKWSNNIHDTTSVDSGLVAGVYTVTVSTGPGDYNCSATASFTIDSSAIILTTVQNNPGCSDSSGSITAIASSIAGGDIFTYNWSNHQTTASIYGLNAGSYAVTVTDLLCHLSATDTVVLVVPIGLSVFLDTLNINCPGNPGQVSVSQVNNGTPPYTYLWSNDSVGPVISDLTKGNYTVAVTDANRCSGVATATVDSSNSPPKIGNFSIQTYPICYGEDENAIITATGFANSTCVVDFGFYNANQNSSINVKDTVVFNQNGVGILSTHYAFITSYHISNGYSIKVQSISVLGNPSCMFSFSDSNTCSNNAWVPYHEGYGSATILFGLAGLHSPQTICLGQIDSLRTYSLGDANYHTWSVSTNQGLTIFSAGNILSPLFSDTAGTYVYHLLEIDTTYGCSGTDSFVIHVVGIHASIDTPIVCGSDPTFQLRASPNSSLLTYRWSATASINSTVTFNTPLIDSTYMVTITDINGCSASATRNIYPDNITVSLNPPTAIICGNTPLAFAATATGADSRNPYSYAWSNGDSSQTVTMSANAPYIISVTATDLNNCHAVARDTIHAGSAPTLTITSHNGVGCNGGNLIVNAASGSGGAPYSYIWSNGSFNLDSIDNLSTGWYRVTVSNATGCSAVDSAYVTSSTTGIALTFTDSISCSGSPHAIVKCHATGGDGTYTFAWTGSSDTSHLFYDTLRSSTTICSVTVTDNNGCSKSASDTLPAYQSNATAFYVQNVTCFGDSTGSVIVIPTWGVLPYHYHFTWSNGGTSASLTNVIAGTYTLTLTNDVGCDSVYTFTITQPSQLTVSLTPSSASCLGRNNGSISLANSGGVMPYSYLWSNGVITQNLTSVGQGTYSVIVSDSLGCRKADTTYVSVLSSLLFKDTVIEGPCYNNGKIITTVSGGNIPYAYNWSDNATTSSIDSNLTSGTYYVTVTDSVGCKAKDTAVVAEPSAMRVGSTVTNVSCFGGNNGIAKFPVGSGGVPSYHYSWSNNPADNTDVDSNLTAGTYTLTITDAVGCQAIQVATISQPTQIFDSLTTVGIECNGSDSGSIYLHVSGGTPGYTYRWYGGQTTSFINGVTSGNYSVTITDSKGCTISTTDTVRSYSAITITDTVLDEACGYQGSIRLGVTGGAPAYSFNWNTTATTQDITGLLQGYYNVLVTDANLCTAYARFIVHNTTLADSITPHNTAINSCLGQVITLHDEAYFASGGINPFVHYHWYNGDTTETTNISLGGNYAITVTYGNCTITESDSISSVSSPVCCFFNPITGVVKLLTDTVLSDTLPRTISDTSIYVGANVKLIVNRSLTLQNCEVVLGTNAQIIIDAGDTLEILGSTLHGCDTMWGGITQNGGTFITNKSGSKRSKVQDAVAALVNQDGGDDDHIWYTDFYRNQTNLGFELYDNAPALDISACNFGMGGYTSMLPAPPGHTNIKRPEYGIYILFTGDVSIPNPTYSGIADTFENMNQGIVTYGSVVNVYHNKFDSIYDYENWGIPNGSAIHAIGDGFGAPAPYGNLLVQTSGSAPDTTATPMFKNCAIAVSAYKQSATVNYNRMENVTYGVYANSCYAAGINVYANYINNTAYGVSLINNGGATQQINYNTIYVYPVVEHYGYAGMGWVYVNGDEFYDSTYAHIYAKTYGIEETEVTTSNTVIKHNTIYRGLNCIELNNTYNTKVADNYMHLANDSAVRGNQAGLYAANCHYLLVSKDTADGDGATYLGAPDTLSLVVTRSRKAGISLYNTNTANLCDNIMAGNTSAKGLGYGMLYAGNCNSVKLYGNTMQASGYGITLLSSGTGTVLPYQGGFNINYQNNDFPGPFTYTNGTYSYVHVVDSPHYRSPIFYYLSGQAGTSYVPVYNSSYPSGEEITFVSQPKDSTEFCELITLPGPQSGNGFARALAVDSGQYYMVPGIDSIAANWLAEKTLYESLYGDTAVLNHDTVMASFYARIDSSDRNAILRSELQNELITDSATIADSVSSGGKPSGYTDALSSAEYLNNIIPTTNIQAANYQAMSKIYLQLIAAGSDTFTSGQIDTIKKLAIQCPYLAGDAVYMARSLYSQIDNTVFFNDLNICQPLPDGSYRMLAASPLSNDTTSGPVSPVEFVHLYPNPAKNVINLNFYAQTVGAVQFELMDALGQPVIKQSLGGRTSAQFSTGSLSNGLYYWQLNDNKRTIQIGKVAIMK